MCSRDEEDLFMPSLAKQYFPELRNGLKSVYLPETTIKCESGATDVTVFLEIAMGHGPWLCRSDRMTVETIVVKIFKKNIEKARLIERPPARFSLTKSDFFYFSLEFRQLV